MKRLFLIPVVSGLILAFCLPAYCGQSTSILEVSIHVGELCTVNAHTLKFDNWNPKKHKSSEGAIANGSVDVTCSKSTRYKIALDAGDNLKAGRFRQMKSKKGGDYMPYKIWKDPHRKREWGDSDTEDTTYPAGTSLCVKGRRGLQSHPIYGTVWPEPRKNGFSSGWYTDEIRVKVYY
jgi:spore coat protein U-like protein